MTINYENLFEKGMLINLKIGFWAARNKLSEDDLGDLPKEIVRGVYDLLDNKEKLEDITSAQNKLRNLVKSCTIPFPIDGVYFILGKDIEKVLDMIKEKKEEIKSLTEEFVNDYENLISSYSEKYPKFFERAKTKYPLKQEIADRFYVSYRMFQINVPSKKLSFISPELYKEEMNKFKNEVEEMKKEVLNLIYNEIVERISNLQRQCIDGKPSQRTLNNLQELFERVENLYSDFIDRKDFKDMINEVKKSVNGVDAKELRNDQKFKTEFAKKMKSVLNDLKNLPDVKSKRFIDF